jgi:SLT domain-containing protein
LLNKILFWETANERKKNNLTKEGNIRDYATIEQLIVLSNLESINALLINNWLSQYKRIQELSKTAISQMRSLIQNQNLENNKKLDS